MKEVVIYTDGAAQGNPGPAGYGIVMMYGSVMKEFSRGFKKSTNNRMELMAVLEALSKLKESCKVEVYSDSSYVVNGMTQWLPGWIKKNWRTGPGKQVKNQDLWKRMVPLIKEHKINVYWVKGHDGNEFNERCDQLATEAAASDNRHIDSGFKG